MIKWIQKLYKRFTDWLVESSPSYQEKLQSIEDNFDDIINQLDKIEQSLQNTKKVQEGLLAQMECLPKITDAGFDLGLDGRAHKNWAVFSAHGNGTDYVKFVDLSNMTNREVIELVKKLEMQFSVYEESRYKFDAPIGMKPMMSYALYEDIQKEKNNVYSSH